MSLQVNYSFPCLQVAGRLLVSRNQFARMYPIIHYVNAMAEQHEQVWFGGWTMMQLVLN